MDPNATRREDIIARGLFRDLDEAESSSFAEEVNTFSGLAEFLDVPVLTHSVGTNVRLFFAMATVMEPEVLLMDKEFMAGDANFLVRAKAKLEGLVTKAEMLVLAAHA